MLGHRQKPAEARLRLAEPPSFELNDAVGFEVFPLPTLQPVPNLWVSKRFCTPHPLRQRRKPSLEFAAIRFCRVRAEPRSSDLLGAPQLGLPGDPRQVRQSRASGTTTQFVGRPKGRSAAHSGQPKCEKVSAAEFHAPSIEAPRSSRNRVRSGVPRLSSSMQPRQRLDFGPAHMR